MPDHEEYLSQKERLVWELTCNSHFSFLSKRKKDGHIYVSWVIWSAICLDLKNVLYSRLCWGGKTLTLLQWLARHLFSSPFLYTNRCFILKKKQMKYKGIHELFFFPSVFDLGKLRHALVNQEPSLLVSYFYFIPWICGCRRRCCLNFHFLSASMLVFLSCSCSVFFFW